MCVYCNLTSSKTTELLRFTIVIIVTIPLLIYQIILKHL